MRLTLVALPLGHPDDLSPRARTELAEADRIFCEDVRKLRELFRRTGVAAKPGTRVQSLPGDRENQVNWEHLLASARSDELWVLVSDAGTPLVNDPGRGAMESLRALGVEVRAIPGPSAPIAAWQWSGGFGLPFVFLGFVPKLRSTQQKAFANFFGPLDYAGTLCFFDTKHQIRQTFDYLLSAGEGLRPLVVAREMTKPHEELIRGTVESVAKWYNDLCADDAPIGELTLLMEGRRQSDYMRAMSDYDELLKIRLAPPREAAKILAKICGKQVSQCYHDLSK